MRRLGHVLRTDQRRASNPQGRAGMESSGEEKERLARQQLGGDAQDKLRWRQITEALRTIRNKEDSVSVKWQQLLLAF